MKKPFQRMKDSTGRNPLRNDHGDISIYTCFFVVGIVMLVSLLLLYASIRITCIAILAACRLVGRDTKTAFLPDEQPPDATQEEWKDTPETAGNSSREHTDAAVPGQNRAEEKLEDYPKVAEESEQDTTPAAGSTNENGQLREHAGRTV